MYILKILTKLHPFNTASIIPASKEAQFKPPENKRLYNYIE